MATVKAIKAMTSSAPQQTIFIDGLGSAAKNYTNFRTHIIADGVIKSVRNFSSYTDSTSVQFYDNNPVTSGYVLEVEAWGTTGGKEYYIGKSNIARPIVTFSRSSQPGELAPKPFWQTWGVRNLSNPFNTNHYSQLLFNGNGCIEGSTVVPSNQYLNVQVPSPSKNTSNTYEFGGLVDQAWKPGEMVFGVVKANNGKYYNLGYMIAPSTASQ